MSDNNIKQKQTFVQSGNEIAVQFCNTEKMYWLETVTEVYEMFRDNKGNLPKHYSVAV